MKTINTIYGDVKINPHFNGSEQGGYYVYDSFDQFLGDCPNAQYIDDDSIDEHLSDISDMITDAIDEGLISIPDSDKSKVWVLNVLESYAGFPPTAKATVYCSREKVIEAKNDAIHSIIDTFVKNGDKYEHELLDEECISEIRSCDGGAYACVTYAEKEIH